MSVGICGFIGSGKDAIGDILCEEKGYVRMSFATAVKEIGSAMFNWPLHMLSGATEESRIWREQVDDEWSEILGYQITPRMALQKIGTEAGRNVFGENIFVGKVLKTIKDKYPDKKIVITDCRFENEINTIRKYGFKIIHVKRPSTMKPWFNEYKNGVDVNEIDNLHPSEYKWIRSEFDFEINNDGTKEELKTQILNIIN